MKSLPAIMVQLVHIEGPLKGDIQELTEPTIRIGRNPDGQVHFPKDLTIVSRNHAEIVREGNRFKLLDHSSNGTFVNGKKIQEAYLKDGDVLTFAEGGPKVSFLTKVLEGEAPIAPEPEPAPTPVVEEPVAPVQGPAIPPTPQPQAASVQPPAQPEPAGQPDQIPVQAVQVPLIIQFGPTLRSFKQLPVTIGTNPACEFVIDHPAIQDRHAQFFFAQNQYWVKDLTGRGMLSINQRPVDSQAPVAPEDILAFSPNGPRFKFLGGGRLAELETPEPEQPAAAPEQHRRSQAEPKAPAKSLKGAKAIFEKFLKR